MKNPLHNKYFLLPLLLYLAVYLVVMAFYFIEGYDVEVESNSVETWELPVNSGDYIRWKSYSGAPLGLNVTAIEGNISESISTGGYYRRYHWGEYKAEIDAILQFDYTNNHNHDVKVQVDVNYNLTGIGLILQWLTYIILGVLGYFTILLFIEDWKRRKKNNIGNNVP